jgi:hypothetical protein
MTKEKSMKINIKSVNWKEFLFSKHTCIILLALIFVVIRIFFAEPYYYASADEARYMTLARNFPNHTYYANTLYLQHPPLFPYVLALADFIIHNDLVSGLVVAFVSSALLCLVLYRWFLMLKKPGTWIFLYLLLLSINWVLAEMSRLVYKETFYILLFWTAVVFYWFGFKKNNYWFYISAIPAALLSFTADHAIFLIPTYIITAILYNNKRSKLHKYLPILISGLTYAIWIVIRLQFYLTHTYAPIGVDGVIENVSSFSPMQLLTPVKFPESVKYLYWGSSDLLKFGSFGYLLNMYPFLITPNLTRDTFLKFANIENAAFILLIYLPLIIILILYAFRKVLSLRKRHDKEFICMAAYFLILISPLFTHGAVYRYGVLAIIPLLYFETEALFGIFKKLMDKQYVRAGFVLFSVLFVLIWIFMHPHLSFTSEKVVQGSEVAKVLKNLPGDGIFVQTGFSEEQAYLLPEKHIYGLVSNDTDFIRYLGIFNISYVVLGNYSWANVRMPSIEYLHERPDMFVPIRTVEQIYPLRVNSDKFVIYQVNKSLLPKD